MKKVLVTGANRGIGLELCRQLIARGDEVIAVCRSGNSALQALNLRVIEGIDVSSARSVDLLQTELGNTQLDWLINNAGILVPGPLMHMPLEEFRQGLDVYLNALENADRDGELNTR